MKKAFLAFIVLASCATGADRLTDPQVIVDRAIDASGGEKFLHSKITFDFRDRSYIYYRDGGRYTYVRIWDDSMGLVRDILSNEGFKRTIDGEYVEVADTMAVKYLNSVNSVIYFAMLPFGLNDPAVIKEYAGIVNLNGKYYYKVRISFKQEGGGKDYQDVFMYWIDMENFHVDYMGYTYETDGGGVRFRQAYHPREIGGIRFQDYVNYRPMQEDTAALETLDSLFINGQLEELSRIELKNIIVGE